MSYSDSQTFTWIFHQDGSMKIPSASSNPLLHFHTYLSIMRLSWGFVVTEIIGFGDCHFSFCQTCSPWLAATVHSLRSCFCKERERQNKIKQKKSKILQLFPCHVYFFQSLTKCPVEYVPLNSLTLYILIL